MISKVSNIKDDNQNKENKKEIKWGGENKWDKRKLTFNHEYSCGDITSTKKTKDFLFS